MPDIADTDEICDRIHAMQRQEDGPYRCGDYLAYFASRRQLQRQEACSGLPQYEGEPVDAECRTKMVSWSYQMSKFCKFKPEVVEISVRNLDRFLDTQKKNPEPVKDVLSCRRMYQLVSMTALYTAVKITEFQILDPRLLSSISKGNYSEEDIEKTESSMLRALQWRVNPPTATSFLRHLIALLPVGESVDAETRNKIFENATHQVEASVLEYELMTTRPSVVAYAALLNSMKGIGGQRIPPPEWVSFLDNVAVILDFDDKSKSEVIEIRERLLGILFESSNFVSKPGKEKLRHCHSSSPHSPRCVLSVTNHNQGDIK